jgi:hypothetical protein
MRFLVAPIDEWAVVNHPWQPHVQHLHVLVAPLLVFAAGLIWSAHVVGKLKNGRTNRVPGLVLTVLVLPMAASGYLLQVAVDPNWRTKWIWVHVVSSVLWVLAFVVHQMVALVSRKQRGSSEAARESVVAPFLVVGSPRGLLEGSVDSPERDAHSGSTGD